MTVERDTSRIVRSWLREDEHASADRVLHIVLDRLDTTPQRRSWWPARRSPTMRNPIWVAAAGAAVIIVAVIGYQLLPKQPGIGGPASTSTPPATPTVAPTRTAAAAFPPVGPLALGTHRAERSGTAFTFEVAATGWRSNGELLLLRGAQVPTALVFVWTEAPVGVYTEPCNDVRGPVLGTASALADAITGIPGVEVTAAPVDITIGGMPAKRVEIAIPADLPCRIGENGFHLWYAPAAGGRYVNLTEARITTWIIETPVGRIWIDFERRSDRSDPLLAEVEAMVDSISFD